LKEILDKLHLAEIPKIAPKVIEPPKALDLDKLVEDLAAIKDLQAWIDDATRLESIDYNRIIG